MSKCSFQPWLSLDYLSNYKIVQISITKNKNKKKKKNKNKNKNKIFYLVKMRAGIAPGSIQHQSN